MTEPSDPATQFLRQIAEGDESAVDRLLPLIYDDLRAIAGRLVFGDHAARTINPTALVHEVYLKLARGAGGEIEGRQHFLRVAAIAMRHMLRDYARDQGRLKRGGGRTVVELQTEVEDGGRSSTLDLLDLDAAMDKLAALHPRQAQVVEMRFFAGLGVAETADLLGISERTAKVDWQMARAWLSQRLEPSGPRAAFE